MIRWISILILFLLPVAAHLNQSLRAQGATNETCVTSPSATVNYNQLCMSATASGGIINLQNVGSATGSLGLTVNGVPITLGGGITNGDPTTGCNNGSIVFAKPSDGTVVCNNSQFAVSTGGFFGDSLDVPNLSVGIFGTIPVLSTAIFQGYPDAGLSASGTCAGTLGPNSSMTSGDFAPTGGCTAAQTVTISTASLAVGHGYSCYVNNQTAAARSLVPLGALDPNGTTFSVTGTLNAGDLITYGCLGH